MYVFIYIVAFKSIPSIIFKMVSSATFVNKFRIVDVVVCLLRFNNIYADDSNMFQ
jgi:hypothetical protein